MNRVMCIDMGGTTIKYGLVDKSLKISAFGKIPTNVDSYEQLLEDLKTIIRPHVLDCDGISLSIPGAVDAQQGTIKQSGAIFCLHSRPLKQDLQNAFKLPVYMENDANCAALAEFYTGAGKGLDNMVMIALGTGIGGTIIANGQLLHTKNHFSGEFGYHIMDIKEPKSWDQMSGSVVKVIELIKNNEPGYQDLDGTGIFDLYHKDPIITRYLGDFFRKLAINCWNLEAMLDPDVIIIGGGISSRDDFIDNLYDSLKELQVEPMLLELPVIKVANYRNHANLIGAYHHIVMREQLQ